MKNLDESAITRTVALSRRLKVTLTFGHNNLLCEWDPDFPESLSTTERRRYRRARDELLAGLTSKIGTKIVIVEA